MKFVVGRLLKGQWVGREEQPLLSSPAGSLDRTSALRFNKKTI